MVSRLRRGIATSNRDSPLNQNSQLRARRADMSRAGFANHFPLRVHPFVAYEKIDDRLLMQRVQPQGGFEAEAAKDPIHPRLSSGMSTAARIRRSLHAMIVSVKANLFGHCEPDLLLSQIKDDYSLLAVHKWQWRGQKGTRQIYQIWRLGAGRGLFVKVQRLLKRSCVRCLFMSSKVRLPLTMRSRSL